VIFPPSFLVFSCAFSRADPLFRSTGEDDTLSFCRGFAVPFFVFKPSAIPRACPVPLFLFSRVFVCRLFFFSLEACPVATIVYFRGLIVLFFVVNLLYVRPASSSLPPLFSFDPFPSLYPRCRTINVALFDGSVPPVTSASKSVCLLIPSSFLASNLDAIAGFDLSAVAFLSSPKFFSGSFLAWCPAPPRFLALCAAKCGRDLIGGGMWWKRVCLFLAFRCIKTQNQLSVLLPHSFSISSFLPY